MSNRDLVANAVTELFGKQDALTPQATTTLGGRTQTDAPTAVTHPDQTDATRWLISAFANQVLVNADYSVLTDFISTDTYHQHNIDAADGLAGCGQAAGRWAADGKALDYTKVHDLVADGEFALVQSKATSGFPWPTGTSSGLDGGRLVEHWDIIQPAPAELPYSNGLF